jgi:sugar lactone lactonase YvrE
VTSFSFAAGDLPTGPRGERGVDGIAVEPEGAVWVATPAGAVRLDPDW